MLDISDELLRACARLVEGNEEPNHQSEGSAARQAKRQEEQDSLFAESHARMQGREDGNAYDNDGDLMMG